MAGVEEHIHPVRMRADGSFSDGHGKKSRYLLASRSDHFRTELKQICLYLEKVILFPQQKGAMML